MRVKVRAKARVRVRIRYGDSDRERVRSRVGIGLRVVVMVRLGVMMIVTVMVRVSDGLTARPGESLLVSRRQRERAYLNADPTGESIRTILRLARTREKNSDRMLSLVSRMPSSVHTGRMSDTIELISSREKRSAISPAQTIPEEGRDGSQG